MKKQTNIRSIFILFFGILISPQLINAQFENVNTQELKTSALSDFNEGKYSLALDKYSALIKKYPKDGVFNYYSGLCLYCMNKNLPDAIQFLKLAISRPNVPSDVWYYLGEAYMKNYQFPEAKKAYSQFNDVATKAELKEKTPARKAEMAENAINYQNIIILLI
jgi:tetratricopeptide (TPR) repeat protein